MFPHILDKVSKKKKIKERSRLNISQSFAASSPFFLFYPALVCSVLCCVA